MTERPSSTKVRRQCFEYWRYRTQHGWRMRCPGCTIEIHPVRDRWEADHLIPHAHGGSDEPPNVRPLCFPCHKTKTCTKDIPEIAKGKRVSDSVYGVRRSRCPMPGGRRSKWKKKITGEVIPRE